MKRHRAFSTDTSVEILDAAGSRAILAIISYLIELRISQCSRTLTFNWKPGDCGQIDVTDGIKKTVLDGLTARGYLINPFPGGVNISWMIL